MIGRTPHASCCCCSSVSNGILRPRYAPPLGCSLTVGNASSVENFPTCRTSRIRWWRAEAEKDVARPSKDSSSSVGSAEVGEAGKDALSPAKGFGSSPAVSSAKIPKDSKPKVKRSGTVRRPPPVKPVVAPQGDPRAQQLETAFIFSWACLGIFILTEGIILGASGLLPEGWDEVLVKYIYPSFTPTVGLFLIGAVFYGLFKYFDGGKKSS